MMSAKSINFINPKNANAFLLDPKGEIVPDVKFPAKKAVTASRLFYADIITHSFKLEQKYNSHEELALAVEMKMYEDLALDLQKEYKISFIEKETELDNVLLIEAFVYEPSAIQSQYAQTFKKIKHLDFLTFPMLAFQTLYTRKNIEKYNDVFIYIGEEEAFLVFYKAGHYISSKKLRSLSQMLTELEAKNIMLTMDELKEILRTKGIDKEHYTLFEYDLYEYILTTFEHIFSTIKNLSLHNRNIYNFTRLDNIYVTLTGTVMPTLSVLARDYFEGTSIYPLNLYSEHETLDFIDILTAHFIQDELSKESQKANFTFYKKRVPFYKTYSGKFVLSAAAGIVLSAAYPLYQQYIIYQTEQTQLQLQTELDHLKATSDKLRGRYNTLKKELARYSQKEKETTLKFRRLRDIADTLVAMKKDDRQYTAMILTINKLLQKYGLTVSKLAQSGAHMIDLELYSKENRRDTIALFMRDLLRQGFEKVTSNEIILSDNSYKSVITIKQ